MKIVRKLISKIQRYDIRNFAANYDKQELQRKLTKNKAKIMLINKGTYEYGYFNFAFAGNMISLILDVMHKGYFPVIRLDNRGDGWTNWDTFLEQPFGMELPEKYEICNLKSGAISPDFRTPYNPKELKTWSKLYCDFLVISQLTTPSMRSRWVRM